MFLRSPAGFADIKIANVFITQCKFKIWISILKYIWATTRFPTMMYVQPAKTQTSLHVCWSEPLQLLEYSRTVKLLTKHHLEFLSLKGSCTCLSESTLVKMPWKSYVVAQLIKICHLLAFSFFTIIPWIVIVALPQIPIDYFFACLEKRIYMVELSWMII